MYTCKYSCHGKAGFGGWVVDHFNYMQWNGGGRALHGLVVGGDYLWSTDTSFLWCQISSWSPSSPSLPVHQSAISRPTPLPPNLPRAPFAQVAVLGFEGPVNLHCGRSCSSMALQTIPSNNQVDPKYLQEAPKCCSSSLQMFSVDSKRSPLA